MMRSIHHSNDMSLRPQTKCATPLAPFAYDFLIGNSWPFESYSNTIIRVYAFLHALKEERQVENHDLLGINSSITETHINT